MIKSLSKPRSKSNLITIHMKFILLVIIGALLWNNNDARQFTSDQLQNASDFIQPEQQRMINISFCHRYTLSSLSFGQMTQTTDNIIDRDVLQDQYVQKTIDSLDLSDCMAILYDYLSKDADKLSVDELIEEVEEYYPELLCDTEEGDLPEPDESTGWN